MTTLSFLLQRPDGVAINMRALYQAVGMNNRYYPDWFYERVNKYGWKEGSEFVTVRQNGNYYHIVTAPLAFRILQTVRGYDTTQQAAELAPYNAPEQTATDLASFLSAATALPILIKPQPNMIHASASESLPAIEVEAAGALAVYKIGGKAAIMAKDLYRIWQTGEDRYFTQWIKLRIEKLYLASGKHYFAFSEPLGDAGRNMLNYVLSLDAALLIADNEPKKRGKELMADLARIKRLLRRTGQSTKANLSDFAGAPLPAFKPAAPQGRLAPPVPATLEEIAIEKPVFESDRTAPLESRVAYLETVVGQLIAVLQSAGRQVMGIIKSTQPMPPMPLRSQIRQLINRQSTAGGIPQDELFVWVYQQLYYRYSVNIRNQRHLDNETHLEACERLGHLDKIYAIVSSAEFKDLGGPAESPTDPQAAEDSGSLPRQP